MTRQTDENIRPNETERVSFTCPGCGRDTTIHVGLRSVLLEKRCFKCVGTRRSGRGGSAPVKGKRIGTHEGRRKDRKGGATAEEQRAVARAASARNRARRGNPTRPPCGSYDECSAKKHRLFSARR